MDSAVLIPPLFHVSPMPSCNLVWHYFQAHRSIPTDQVRRHSSWCFLQLHISSCRKRRQCPMRARHVIPKGDDLVLAVEVPSAVEDAASASCKPDCEIEFKGVELVPRSPQKSQEPNLGCRSPHSSHLNREVGLYGSSATASSNGGPSGEYAKLSTSSPRSSTASSPQNIMRVIRGPRSFRRRWGRSSCCTGAGTVQSSL